MNEYEKDENPIEENHEHEHDNSNKDNKGDQISTDDN